MAGWRDQLYPASFRGVAFHVRGGDGLLGRRVQQHEFIGRDIAEPEDLGGIGEEFSVEAFVLDDRAREALRQALATPGPGQLVHPRLGVLTAQVGQARWRWNRSSRETFNITFYRVQPQGALSRDDTSTLLQRQADAAQSAVTQRFGDRFFVPGLPAFVPQAALDLLDSGTDVLRSLGGAAQGVITAVSDVDLAITDLKNAAADLVRAPLQLASRIAGVIASVVGIDNDMDRAMDSYRRIESSWGDVEPVSVTTPTRQLQADNQAALRELFVATAAIEASRFIATRAAAIDIQSNEQSPFASADEAYRYRDGIVATLDTIAATTTPEVYLALRDLQAQLARHIEAHGNTLPRSREITLAATQSSLVLAHRLYGDALRESDLVARNRVAHPLFLKAGTRLTVLEAGDG